MTASPTLDVRPPVIAVVGPTATGKTSLGVYVAQQLKTDVISFDSQLVYRGLAIGTAKPTEVEQQGVVHYGMDLCDPTQECSAGWYAQTMRPVLDSMIFAQRVPILVGGTGFYLNALLYPQAIPEVSTNESYRQQLRAQLAQEGPDALYGRLKQLDPERAEVLHPNDTIRVIRALELIEALGKPIPKGSKQSPYQYITIGLTYANRQSHIAAIEHRLAMMFNTGFLDEVKTVYEQYGHCPALRHAHGYPECVAILEGRMTLDEAKAQIAINIRQYSKRQMTWFRKQPDITWFCVDEHNVGSLQKAVMLTVNQKYPQGTSPQA